VGSLTAPPGRRAPSGAAAEQALFLEARRRRRRRWLAGIAAAVAAAAVVAVSAVTWLPRAFDQDAGPPGAAGAALVGRSSGPAGRARFTYRVVTAGVPEAHGTEDVTFSGNNRSFSFSDYSAASGPQPAQVYSGTERLVDGQVYTPVRVRGRLRWVHEPSQVYVIPRIIDPRRLLRMLAPYARFQATGYQVIGGVRLKVLRATDPGSLTRRALLPVLYTSGLSVGSLAVWVDGQGVVHRMAFTFISYAKIALSKPVSTAALANYQRALRAQARTMARLNRDHVRTGKQMPQRPINLAARRVQQAFQRAYPVRRGNQVTTTTVTFSAIGQPQHITVPPNAMSYRQFVLQTTSRRSAAHRAAERG
jgi:hypothetical protein